MKEQFWLVYGGSVWSCSPLLFGPIKRAALDLLSARQAHEHAQTHNLAKVRPTSRVRVLVAIRKRLFLEIGAGLGDSSFCPKQALHAPRNCLTLSTQVTRLNLPPPANSSRKQRKMRAG